MSTQPEILVERDGAIGWIRINRPDRLNALTVSMRDELNEALAQHEADDDVRSIVLIGTGRAFCTGGDMNVMQELIEADDEAGFERLIRAGAEIVEQIDRMNKVVIAAVNGPAVGAGASLALACDLRIASESASIGFGFLRVGMHPDWGGTYFLPRLVGPALAAEFFFTGEMIKAERAERLGLFNRVVAPNNLEPAVRTLAGQIAAAPIGVVCDTKRTLRRSFGMDLAETLEIERQAQLRAFRSPDFREGITSFLEKRAPRFEKRVSAGRETA